MNPNCQKRGWGFLIQCSPGSFVKANMAVIILDRTNSDKQIMTVPFRVFYQFYKGKKNIFKKKKRSVIQLVSFSFKHHIQYGCHVNKRVRIALGKESPKKRKIREKNKTKKNICLFDAYS